MPEPITLSIIAAISSAVTIVKDLPAAVAVAKKFGIDIGMLERQTNEIASQPVLLTESTSSYGPFDILVEGFVKELEHLSREYHRTSDTWDQPEKESHQKRIAAKACELMSNAEKLIKDSIENFDSIKDFFCNLAKT